MNEMTQAPKRDLQVEALLARIQRVCGDAWLSTNDKVFLALGMAESCTSLVAYHKAFTPCKEANGQPVAREALVEKVYVRLHDGREFTFDTGFPGWLER